MEGAVAGRTAGTDAGRVVLQVRAAFAAYLSDAQIAKLAAGANILSAVGMDPVDLIECLACLFGNFGMSLTESGLREAETVANIARAALADSHTDSEAEIARLRGSK